MKYINECDGIIDRTTCANAIYSNHFKCFKYIFNNNNKCEYEHNIIAWAMQANNFKIFKYAITHGCPYYFLEYMLHDLDYKYRKYFKYAIVHGYRVELEIVDKYNLEQYQKIDK